MMIGDNHFPIFVSENKGQWELPKVQDLSDHKSNKSQNSSDNVEDQIPPNDDVNQEFPLIRNGMGDQSSQKPVNLGNQTSNNTEQPSISLPINSHTPQQQAFSVTDNVNKFSHPSTHSLNNFSPLPDDVAASYQNSPIIVPNNLKDYGPRKKLFAKSPPTTSKPKPPAQNLPPSKPNLPLPISKTHIPTFNKFAPLIRNQKSTSSSSMNMDSSSCSGPIFPPGFENNIPPHTKLAQLRKRKKKLEKKKKTQKVFIIRSRIGVGDKSDQKSGLHWS